MSNFGFQNLRLVSPYEPSFVDARSAVGAAEVMSNAEVYDSVADAVADCSLVVATSAVGAREVQQSVHVLHDGAKLIRQRLAQAPVALLFGSEKTGLSNEELSHCHFVVRIPTRQEHISMNLGQAVAIALYEISRGVARPAAEGEAASATPECDAAPSEDVERLTEVLYEALCVSGYLQSSSASPAREKLRRLLRRIPMRRADAVVLLGMVRKMLWKMKREDSES